MKPALPLVILLLSAPAGAQDVSPIVNEGIVEASVERVWAAWTTGEGLRAWMAPHADIDFRIGGKMRANYNPNGSLSDPQTIENTILSFEPQRMLSMQATKPPAGFPFPSAIQRMWTVVYFEAAGPTRTRVRAVSLGFGTDDESQKMRGFFVKGNDTTVLQLQKHFAGR